MLERTDDWDGCLLEISMFFPEMALAPSMRMHLLHNINRLGNGKHRNHLCRVIFTSQGILTTQLSYHRTLIISLTTNSYYQLYHQLYHQLYSSSTSSSSRKQGLLPATLTKDSCPHFLSSANYVVESVENLPLQIRSK